MSSPKRGRRSKRSLEVFQCETDRPWRLNEKKALLEAVKRHGPDDVAKIQKFLPLRTQNDITLYIRKIRLARVFVPPKKTIKTPLEKWMALVYDLVKYEQKDYSEVLAPIMACISHGECKRDVESTDEPNYSKIYQFLEAILSSKEPPRLSKIDSAVFLDLMQSLSGDLRSTKNEVDMIRNLLLWKYDLLTAPVYISDRHLPKQFVQMALENEWPKDNKYGLPTGDNSRKRQKSHAGDKTYSTHKKQAKVGNSASLNKAPASDIIDSEGNKTKSSTSVQNPPNNEIDSCKVSEESSNTKGVSTHDGHSENGLCSGPSETQAVPKRTLRKRTFSQSKGSNVELPLSTSDQGCSMPVAKVDTCKPSEIEFKKPLLYTLNPLCIPVSLLGLKLNKK